MTGPQVTDASLEEMLKSEILRMYEEVAENPRAEFHFYHGREAAEMFDYDREWLGITARTTRYGEVLDAGSTAFNDVHMDAKWITDLEFRFKPMGDRFTIALGGNNIFDVYPDNIPRGRAVNPATGLEENYAATRYVAPFSNFSPFGFNGRFLYGRVDINF